MTDKFWIIHEQATLTWRKMVRYPMGSADRAYYFAKYKARNRELEELLNR